MLKDAQNTLKPLKQVVSFRKESRTTTLTKSMPCSHVLNCIAMFNDLLWQLVLIPRREIEVYIINHCGPL